MIGWLDMSRKMLETERFWHFGDSFWVKSGAETLVGTIFPRLDLENWVHLEPL